jgi:hypothetical protein
MPAGMSDELQVSVKVRKSATPGEQVKLTASATATGAVGAQASASAVTITAPAPSTSTGTTPPPGSALPPVSLPPLPDLGISPSNPSGLFPTVSPGASTSPSPSPQATATAGHARVHVVTAAATVPLSPRLIGGQLAGLVVLASAVGIAIARLSLRAPRPQDGTDAPSKP